MGKWIFNKHTKNMLALDSCIVSIASKRSSSEEVASKLIDMNLYNPREKVNGTTIANKFKELQFYNLVYKSGDDYILSTLGNYYYKAIYNDNISMKQDAYINTLFNVQFPHEYNKSKSNLFPFRLIFQLMTEKDLKYKLYNNEILALLYNFEYNSEIEEERKQEYEELIRKILKFRNIPNEKKLEYLYCVESIADRIHQLDYYVLPICIDMNIIKKNEKNVKERIEFYHPQKKNTKSKPTKRIYTEKEYSLSNDKYDYIIALIAEMPAYRAVYQKKELLSGEYTQLVFNSISDEFLDRHSSDESTNVVRYIKELSNELIYHSENSEKFSPEKFEIKLCELFNMFEDVKAERISGAGKTDVECMHIESKIKFNIEAKSTSKKLLSINSGRLQRHMNISNSQYAIVVSSDFAPSAKSFDILNTNIVSVRAADLCEYIQNMALNNNNRYSRLNEIILSNLGMDITEKIKIEISKEFGVTQKCLF